MEKIESLTNLWQINGNAQLDFILIIAIQISISLGTELWNYHKIYSKEEYKTLAEKTCNMNKRIEALNEEIMYGKKDDKGVKLK